MKSVNTVAKELKLDKKTVLKYTELLHLEMIQKPVGKTMYKYLSEESINSLKEFFQTHSLKEMKKLLQQKTLEERYGDPHFNNREKLKSTLKEKYGDVNYRNIEQMKQTKKERYGSENYNNPEKAKQTNLERYGVESAVQSEEVKEKVKAYFQETYGCNPSQLESSKEKSRKTCEERYGAEFFTQSVSFKEKPNPRKGIPRPSLSLLRFVQIQEERENLEKEFGVIYSESELAEMVERSLTAVSSVLKDFNTFGVLTKYVDEKTKEEVLKIFSERKKVGVSSLEKEVVEFVKGIYLGEIVENDKKILNGKELDVYLPERNFAIEFNGLYWHSDKATEKEFAKTRHLKKTLECEEKGIRLLHIFEDDWLYRKEIVKDIISQALGKPQKKIFARKCTLKEVGSTTYKTFLEENHLQGWSFADVRLGLYYNEELVECIGIHSRGTHDSKPELVRLCTKKGFQVLGGFSKLLKHSGFEEIISYVDRGTFNGNGYKAVGFTVEKINPPTYFYVKNTERFPRYKFMRKKIKKLFERGELKFFDPTSTEAENMYKNGYAKIWNCGTIKVIWKR